MVAKRKASPGAKPAPAAPVHDDTRARLLATARDAYLDGGPAAFSLREVARRVGVSAAAVYRHFDGKDALLGAACEQGFAVFAGYLMKALTEPTPALRLRATADQYLRFGLENPRDYRFMFMSSLEELAAPVDVRKAPDRGPGFRVLVDRVRENMDAGLIAPGEVEPIAVLIWANVHGLVSLRLAGHLDSAGDDDAFTAFYRQANDRFLAALAP